MTLGIAADRKPRRRLTLSRSLQVVAVLVVVVILGFTVQQQIRARQATLHAADRQMWRLDMVLAEQTGRAVETIDFVLRGAIDQVLSDPAGHPTQDQLSRQMLGVRQMQSIDITDTHGRIVASSRPVHGEMMSQAGLSVLDRHAHDPQSGLQISEPLRDEKGAWVALLTRRVSGPDGVFRGMAAATINLGYFTDFYKAVELSEGGAILLHRRDGVVLTRFPYDDTLPGRSYAALPPFRDILSREIAGTVAMPSPLDGSLRILAIRALKAFPLAVNISVSADDVLADWRRQSWEYGAFAAAVGLCVALLLFQLAARSRDVERLLEDSRVARDSAEEAHRSLMIEMEERARAEEALRKAQRVEAVGQLTGGVAHDFNNLLTVVLGNVDLLADSLGPGPHQERLDTVRSAAERGARLTGQLLAFARRQPMQPRPVDINAMIRDVVPLLRSAIGSRVTLEPALEPQLGAAMVDPTQIELVLLNLVINARDAMPQGGVIRVATGMMVVSREAAGDDLKPGRYIRIEVSDSGMGMSEEVQARAFEPFFTTKAPGLGSGLGLSQVYGVARQLGGAVRLESALGRGTMVTVLLPAAASETPPSAVPGPQTARPTRNITILVVDDDDGVRTTSMSLLRHLGYQVLPADGVAQALEVLHSDRPVDLVFTDVVMPGESGVDLARHVRRLRPELPVVFVSGYADPGAIAGEIPLDRLLRKPFRAQELNSMIEAALA